MRMKRAVIKSRCGRREYLQQSPCTRRGAESVLWQAWRDPPPLCSANRRQKDHQTDESGSDSAWSDWRSKAALTAAPPRSAALHHFPVRGALSWPSGGLSYAVGFHFSTISAGSFNQHHFYTPTVRARSLRPCAGLGSPSGAGRSAGNSCRDH